MLSLADELQAGDLGLLPIAVVSRTPPSPFLVLLLPNLLWTERGRWQKLQLNGILCSMVGGSHSRKTARAPSLDDRQSSFLVPVRSV